ncbi:PREDICTED: cytochrome P450 2D17-like [Gekko japonicus]|uniref:Cytochrome P450 2D17-like n=1 Tax=Gekko japonicus TaxID=146911 RepID=A0ABM1L695_GEKJA|nr:PREDICTED: cytochrome P450 2D17-like [Gekko japonicus]
MAIVLLDPTESIISLMTTIEAFGLLAGFKINKGKTKVIAKNCTETAIRNIEELSKFKCGESLADRIRNNDMIKGLRVKGEVFKLQAFADDLIFIVEEPEYSLAYLIEDIQEFGSDSKKRKKENLHEQKNLVHLSFAAARLAKRYGAVMSFQAGWHTLVILNGFKAVKEALTEKKDEFADRPYIPLLSLAGYSRNCEGILMARKSNGWKEQRRFCVSTLKVIGMRKKTLEKRISEEAKKLCSEFKSQEGAAFDPETLLNNAIGKIICTLTFGDHFDYNDVTFLKLIHFTKEIMKIITASLPQIMGSGTWLSYIPGPHQKIKEIYNDISAILSEIVTKHKETRDPTYARDLIDTFLEEMEKAKGNPKSSFNEHNLIKIILEMFVAGLGTTTSTKLWGLLKMVLHPEVQKQVHKEIEEVLGKDNPPMMEDQPNLPYTNAVIHEIQRCADIVPIAFPYKTHQEVQIDKFVIPKETIVFNHLSSVLNDETMWEKPHQFYPEHFLDANGQFVKREAFLPFSAGRHACPGEPLAKMELFIFFTSLLQCFTFSVPENHPRPSEDRLFALTVTPTPFQICAIPR